MVYSIGEVASATGIAISTLRYYDREGMFPQMERSNGGVRRFSEQELNTLRVIECLKTSGMSIQEIKDFLSWCREGDASLQKRQALFHRRLELMNRQMEELRKTMKVLQYKCWYYDTAAALGSEEAVRSLPEEEIPEALREYRI